MSKGVITITDAEFETEVLTSRAACISLLLGFLVWAVSIDVTND